MGNCCEQQYQYQNLKNQLHINYQAKQIPITSQIQGNHAKLSLISSDKKNHQSINLDAHITHPSYINTTFTTQIRQDQKKDITKTRIKTQQSDNSTQFLKTKESFANKYILPQLAIPIKSVINELNGNIYYEKIFNKFRQLRNYQLLPLHKISQLQNGQIFITQSQQEKNIFQFSLNIATVYYPNGQFYLGQVLNQKLNGTGVYIFPNGDYCLGEFQNNKPQGMCKLVKADYIYDGNLNNGKAQGQGIFQKNNYYFQGLFKEGKYKSGRLEWQNSGGKYIYNGQFENDKFNGYGTLQSQAGVYTGYFINGKKNKFGIFKWFDGSIYQGSYVQNLKFGYGQLYGIDGEPKYKGQWQNDLPTKGLKFIIRQQKDILVSEF